MSRQLLWAAMALLVTAGAIASVRFRSNPAGGQDLPAVAATDAEEEFIPGEAPEFPEGLKWLQGGPLKLADQRGRVVVVHFWTNGCVNCAHNYPVYRAWHEKYDAKKVAIVGVHTPEFDWEAPAERVEKKASENGLKFPIVLDPDLQIWKAWSNQCWPAIYLVDKKGLARYRWEGELDLDTAAGKRFAARIDQLLDEKP
jgi:thiol-disulfide isomerase/thioredoxin